MITLFTDFVNKFIEFFDKLTCEKKIISYDNAKHRIVHSYGSEERIEDICNEIAGYVETVGGKDKYKIIHDRETAIKTASLL